MQLSSEKILFEKFEIISCFKKDDSSAVYLANHIYLAKKIILKVLNLSKQSDSSVTERFKREAKILAKLDHPNIINVLDFGVHEKFLYISFEYFESANLRTHLNSIKLSTEQIKNIAAQLFNGLNYAHSNDVIHRDLKPENILLDNNFKLKISDFGLAQLGSDNFITSKTSLLGTPSYMSPEQILGEKLTIQSDLFSAGIILYELAIGDVLFNGNDINNTINSIINFTLRDVDEKLNNCDEKLKELIVGLLNPNKKKRIVSSGEALTILGAASVAIEPTKNQIKKTKFVIPILGFLLLAALVFVLSQFFADDKNIPETKTESNQTLQLSEPQVNDSLQSETAVDRRSNPKAENKSLIKREGAEDRKDITKTKAEIETGLLFVECKPWGYLFVDGDSVDTTPISNPIILESGVHHLKIAHPDYPLFQESIKIAANETSRIHVNLDTLFAFFDCKIFPWGDVYIDDVLLGQTPFTNLKRIHPGRHTLRFENPAYPVYSKEVEFLKGDTVKYSYNFNLNNRNN